MLKKKITTIAFLVIIILVIIYFYQTPSQTIETVENKIEHYLNKAGNTREEVEELLASIEKWQQKISEDDTDFDSYAELARSYRYLGDVDKAIEIYKSYKHEKSGRFLFLYNNNLAKIYDSQNKYLLANTHYLEIINNLKGNYLQIYQSLIKNYIKLKDKDNAWKYYIEFQKAGGEDIELLQALEEFSKK